MRRSVVTTIINKFVTYVAMNNFILTARKVKQRLANSVTIAQVFTIFSYSYGSCRLCQVYGTSGCYCKISYL
jgi:hypothetical protein